MIILASQSEIRRALLTAAGVPFTSETSPFHETAFQAERMDLSAQVLAQHLALAKAEATSVQYPHALVIGVDQTLECEGRILHKPATLTEAKTQLQFLSGKTHVLHTAYSIVQNEKPLATHCETSSLTMLNFTNDFLEAYLANNGEALLSSVGCYHLEAQGVRLMQKIEGDYFAILGLPLLPLLIHLRQLGALSS